MGVPRTPVQNIYNTAKRVGTRFPGPSSKTGWTPASAVIVSSRRLITGLEVQPSMGWRSPTSTTPSSPLVSVLVSLPQATITRPARAPVTNNTRVIPWWTGGATGTKDPGAYTPPTVDVPTRPAWTLMSANSMCSISWNWSARPVTSSPVAWLPCTLAGAIARPYGKP